MHINDIKNLIYGYLYVQVLRHYKYPRKQCKMTGVHLQSNEASVFSVILFRVVCVKNW